MNISDLISNVKQNATSVLNPPCQSSQLISAGLPDDLTEFYSRHDGGTFFLDKEYSWEILPFSEMKRHDDIFDKFDCNGLPISQDWIVFLREIDFDTPYAIDLSFLRCGFCYQVSRYDYPYILARSFSEIFDKILNLRGAYPPWYQNGYQYYGDPCASIVRS